MKKTFYGIALFLTLGAHLVCASESQNIFSEHLGKRITRSSSSLENEYVSTHSSQHKNKKTRTETKILQKEKYGPFGEEYAISTTDTSFKHMLSTSVDQDSSVMESFLNSFVPQFAHDPVDQIVSERPVSIPALKRKGRKQTFMDLHVKTRSGIHYIIEMQAQRHEQFDERCLFYACSTYSKQLSEKDLKSKEWYRLLRPTIALQILDFDTNRAQGITGIKGRDGVDLIDTLYERAKANPLPIGQYIKNYVMTCSHSGQKIEDLRMIQVELPRSPAQFPPHKDFTETDWWLSVLRYSEKYTHQLFESLEQKGFVIPNNIRTVFHRLEYAEWDPQMQDEYKEDIKDRENFKTTLKIEYDEGKAKGKEEGIAEENARLTAIHEEEKAKIEAEHLTKQKEMVLEMLRDETPDHLVIRYTKITQQALDEIKAELSQPS